ncbi:MAG: glyoxalase, partial [Herminiimonas sp.]|nr:glyoxalase [Herminiimonas sp.]
LKTSGVVFRERTVPGMGLHQVFVHDPEGVMVELNYPAAEKAAIEAAIEAAIDAANGASAAP